MDLTRWGWWSIALNVVLALLHGLVAARSGSLAVTAEVIHNGVDLLGAVAVLVGIKLATRESRAFPYGLYKVENLVAAVFALLVFVTGYEVLRHALWAAPLPVRVDGWMLAMLVLTGLVPLVFAHFELRAANAAGSPALVADAREYQIHAFTTGLALAALAGEWMRVPFDRVAAALIVLPIVRTGWDLLRDAMRVLLDASLDAETLDAIRRVIQADPAVSELTWLTGRNAGRFRFVEAGVVLRASDAARIPALSARIERAVREQVKNVERALIHAEAPVSEVIRCAVPLADRTGVVSAHFGEAPYFALLSVRRRDGALLEQTIVENPHAGAQQAKGIRVAEWLIGLRIDRLLCSKDLQRKGPIYVLRDAGVEVLHRDAHTLDDVIALGREAPRRATTTP